MVASASKSISLGLAGTSYGVAATRTTRLAGLTSASFKPLPTIHRVMELGRFGPSKIQTKVSDGAEGKVAIDATYEHLIYLLQGFFGVGTVTGTSGSAQFTHTFNGATTVTPSPGIYTFEWTDSTDAYLINGALFKTLKIAGKKGSVWTAEGDIVAANMTTGALTTTLSDPSPVVNLIRMADTNIYLDISTGTIGTTVVSASLIEFSLELESGYHTKLFGGAMTPGNYGPDRHDGRLKVTLEENTTSKALFDALISTGGATVVRQAEIRGQQTTALVAKLQLNGVIDNQPELWKDDGGNRALDFEFAGVDSTTLGNWIKALMTIASSTIA